MLGWGPRQVVIVSHVSQEQWVGAGVGGSVGGGGGVGSGGGVGTAGHGDCPVLLSQVKSAPHADSPRKRTRCSFGTGQWLML